MKKYILITVLLAVTSLLLIPACKYNVAEPEYPNSEFVEPQVKPKINSVDPANAVPGVNIITINGENLNIVPNERIYLEIPGPTVSSPDIIEKTSTFITIRRPNLVTDSCVLKLVPDSGFIVKSGSFKIDKVIEPFGSFLDNFPLGGIAIDNAENVYVLRADTNRTIFKITPDGQRTIIGRTTRLATNSTMGPGEYLYIFSSNRLIERFNIAANQLSDWHRLSANRALTMGSFDSNGNLFACGNRIDLWVIHSDTTVADFETKFYPSTSDTIFALQVHKEGGVEYLYLAVGSSSGRGIWRHIINPDGSLSSRDPQPYISLQGYGIVRDLAFTSDGKIFIGTDGPNSVLVYTNAVDYFYKNIIPPFTKYFQWGHGNYLYLISGNSSSNAALAQNWSVYKVDMGITGE